MKIGRLNRASFAKTARRAMFLFAFAVLGTQAAMVAKVGDVGYETLEAAITAASSGSMVAVCDDIRQDKTLTIKGKDLTLDLNGKTLTVATEGDGIVVQDATLNLGNSGGTGKYVFECTASGSDGIFLHNTREDGVSILNINSNVEILFKPGVNSAIHAYGEAGTAVVNMNAGNVYAKGEGQRVSAVIIDQNAAFNMKGGTFNLNVDFDTFSQNNNDVVGVLVWGQNGVQKNGTVKIEGGSFNVGGKNAFAQIVQVGMKNGKSDNVSVEISGGEIVLSPSGDGEGYVFTPYNAAYASATMSGGRIRGTVTALTATASGADTANMIVSGGTFPFEVKESYCADGFTVKATTDADGNTVYGVVEKTELVNYVTLELVFGDNVADEDVVAAKALYAQEKYETCKTANEAYMALFGVTWGKGYLDVTDNTAPLYKYAGRSGSVSEVRFYIHGTLAGFTSLQSSGNQIDCTVGGNHQISRTSYSIIGVDGADGKAKLTDGNVQAYVAGGYASMFTASGKLTIDNIEFTSTTSTTVGASATRATESDTENEVASAEMEIKNCTFRGRLYVYDNFENQGKMTYSIHNCVFDGSNYSGDSNAYAIFAQCKGGNNLVIKDNAIAGFARGINIDHANVHATIEGNTISVTDTGRSCIQLSSLAKADIVGNTLKLTGGNAITLHEKLLTLGVVPEVSISGNTVTGTGYLVYDDAVANGKEFTSGNLKLTYATDNTVAETVDTTKGVKGSTAYITSTAVNNEVQHYVAQVGTTGYTALAAAIAALSAENHTLTLLKENAWDAATPVYWAAGTQSGYAATLTAALTAAYKADAGAITIVCRPGADVGTMTHGHVADDLTIYGNDAFISDGECDLEVDQYKYSRATGAQATDGAYLEKDITITAYELDNLGVWGERHTAHTVTVNLTDCDGKALEGKTNVQRVYISGTTGVNNITLTGCDFLTKATAVYSNADGAIKAVNCSFTDGQGPFNINHKANGTQTVAVENCRFTNCGDADGWKQFAAPIRLVNSGAGTQSAEVTGCAFAGTVGANGDILLGDGRTGQASNDVELKVVNTKANIQAQKPGYYGGETVDATKKATATSPAEGTLETSVAKLLPVDPRTLGYATSGKAEALPATPDMNGEVVNVTAAQAQYVLDGAYGSIDGKTINFTESINDTLILGRASKYDGSKTVYRYGSHAGEALSYADFIAYKNQSGWTESCYYERTVENVTFTANKGVTVKNFEADGGAHIYAGTALVYDYVRDTGSWVTEGSCYYKRAILKNITFQGLTFKAKTDFNTSESTTVYDGFTFTGCTFEIGSTAAGNYALRYYNENNNGSVRNLVVESCTFRNCYQGIYAHHVKGIAVKGCTFETTGHNAIAIQSQGGEKGACDHGAVVITGNTFKNVGDRIIRFNVVGAGTTITISDNTADGNSGKLDSATGKREIVKAESLPENASEIITASNNDWGANAVVEDVFADVKPVVAKVGETEYDTLEAAIAAAKDGEMVTLLADATVSDYVLDKGVTIRSAGETRYEIKGLKAIAGSGVTLENVFLNLDQTLDIGGTDTTLKNCVMRAKDVGYWDIVDGKTTGFTGGTAYQGNAYTYLVRVSGTRVSLTDCLIDGTDNEESYFPNMCLAPVTGTDVTMTRCTFNEGYAACYYSTPRGTWTLEDCTFTKIFCYNIQAGDTAAKIVVKGCSLAGWTSFGSSMTEVSFEDCAFAKSSDYATIVAYKNATFSGCTFTEDYKDNLFVEANTAVDLNGCSVVDGDGQPSATVSLAGIVELDDGTAFAALDATKDENGKYTAGTFVGSADAVRAAVAEGRALKTDADGFHSLVEAVAQIGSVGYASLADALAAAKDGETVTLLANANGDGIVVPKDAFPTGLVVDFAGHTYTVGGLLVGSSATKSNGFQLLEGNKITFKNGALVGATATAGEGTDWTGAPAILIQNYCDLTLEKMTVKGGDETCYTLSNNNGDIVIADSTIVAGKGTKYGPFAFDVCRYSSYPSVHVTVTGDSVIDGDVEVSGTVGDGQSRQLDIAGGTFKGTFAVAEQPANIAISGGTFSSAVPPDYCAAGFIPTANGDGTYGVKEGAYVAAIGEAKYETLEAALAAADAGATVKMLADVVLTEKQTIAKALVLDLNGKTISSTVNQFITIAKGGDLTVNDATGEGCIKNTVTESWGGTIKMTGGVLTVNGGTIAANSATSEYSPTIEADTSSSATINVVGGRIEADRTGNARAINLRAQANVTLNVTGGEIVGSQNGIYSLAGNTINISAGVVAGKAGSAVYSGDQNKITISGGTLTPGGTAAALAIGGGSIGPQSCTVTVGREGGTVADVTIPSIDFKPGYSANMATVNLLSGIVQKFLNFDKMTVEKVSQGKDTLLVGTDITACLPGSDLLCQLDVASGLYEIVKLTVENAVAIVTHDGTETPYRTVEQAVRAVADGDTLTLKVDHTGSQFLSFSAKNVTVDLGGKTLTYTGATGGLSSALSFNQSTASDNTVTVKNGTIVAKAQDATCVRAEMTGDLSKTLKVVFGENLTLTSGNTSRYGGVVLGTGARTAFPCEKMTKGGLLVTEGEKVWIYGETATAFTHAKGSEVTLLNDWYDTDTKGTVKVPSSGTFASAKLNLNGHTISSYGVNPAVLMGMVGENEDTAAKTLEISGGTIKTFRHGAAVCGSNKTLTLDGVTLTTTGDKMYGLYANGTTSGNTVTLKNKSAVLSEKATGIYFPGAGTLTVEDSNVTGGVSGIEVRAGVLNVSGTSVIASTAMEFSFTNNDNGTTTTGAAVAAVKHTVGNDLAVTITGGTFKGPRGFYANDPNVAKPGTVTVSISGGVFSTDVEKKYLADGCKTVQQTIDGTLYYVVGPAITQIGVTLGGEKKEMPFTDAWLAANIGEDAATWTTKALEEKAANGLAKWQCYLFGLDPRKEDAKVVATAGQGTNEAIPLTVANADASASPLVTGGYVTVAYVLMGSNDGTAWMKVATSDERDGLAIPLTGTPYKFYRVDVTVTSAEGN